MLKRLKDIVDNCYDGGHNSFSSFRKVPAIASVAGCVIDFSMAPGNPKPNYYTGSELTATLFDGVNGIWTGGNVTPKTKILKKLALSGVSTVYTPMILYVLDYLMFYPLIDMDNTDEQFLINNVSLPRYSDGVGVKAFVVATNPYVGNGIFTMTYTNHLGEQNRITRVITCNTAGTIATLIHSGVTAGLSGTFIDTPNGEGIRSIQSITFTSPNGGLASVVLCKVIENVFLREITNPAEWDFLSMKGNLPIIKDGAYINFIGVVAGAAVAGNPLIGYLETIWD